MGSGAAHMSSDEPAYQVYVSAYNRETGEQVPVEVLPAGEPITVQWWLMPIWWRHPVKWYILCRHLRIRKRRS